MYQLNDYQKKLMKSISSNKHIISMGAGMGKTNVSLAIFNELEKKRKIRNKLKNF
jgi:superfamily II DNA or RNA helicase